MTLARDVTRGLDSHARVGSETSRELSVERDRGPETGRRLLCRQCLEPVTAEGDRIEIGGAHRHRRTNPAGVLFDFGCFGSAPGAVAVGIPTGEHSWFPGYRWSYSLCRGCTAQLGWHFEGGSPPFHGLILERLRRED